MRVHWIQHVPYEGLGYLESWLAKHATEVSCTRIFAGEPLPPAATVDLLIIVGGPMSVNDEPTLPWLAAEKSFIARVIAADIPTLGICLGAQLIAAALGARVGPSREREIGWWPVEGVAPTPGSPSDTLFRFPERLTCLQWHGESFALPAGAHHLARSEGCEHQGMQIGRRVIGVQFHPEATPQWLSAVLAHSPGAPLPGPYVMAHNELTTDVAMRCREGNLLLGDLMEFLIAD
jgi:GMP synthase-like glutamine amidotransferase